MSKIKTETLISLFPQRKHLSTLDELYIDNYRAPGKHDIGSDLINYLFKIESFGQKEQFSNLATSNTTNIS